ncbi:hypothetical protein BU26DRAFT_575906 [Trematosphaeria pertusa]|uniref:Uncharacterized protein n=1 Tax=Trematosphaeria pertusa TaxID=390896 RepID=A0A6A6J423_9PLEO|nr:uncharacterized protein BU26DRAFT_575906 [Trematosphaeria pertusa]KAF2257318.1 hypothetical protein BU26DRAFT_575906 [Trematosphaeria pertusa]
MTLSFVYSALPLFAWGVRKAVIRKIPAYSLPDFDTSSRDASKLITLFGLRRGCIKNSESQQPTPSLNDYYLPTDLPSPNQTSSNQTQQEWQDSDTVHEIAELILLAVSAHGSPRVSIYKSIRGINKPLALQDDTKLPDLALAVLQAIRKGLNGMREEDLGAGVRTMLAAARDKGQIDIDEEHREWRTVEALAVIMASFPDYIEALGFEKLGAKEGKPRATSKCNLWRRIANLSRLLGL